MRVPQVSDRIKEAPAQALRGVFAGIGQVLLVADRLRNKTPAAQQAPPARVPEPSVTRENPATPAAPTPPAPPTRTAPPTPTTPPTRTVPPTPTVPAAPRAERVTEARDLDKTGNVRLLTSEEARAGQTAPIVDATVTVGEEQGAPLPNYDELSIASLRARLRNLDAAQVKQLADYEKTHAARTDVMTMFERRIAKLEAQTSAAADARAEAKAEAEVEAREEVADEVRAEVAAEAEDEA
jgi:hypothetical protein